MEPDVRVDKRIHVAAVRQGERGDHVVEGRAQLRDGRLISALGGKGRGMRLDDRTDFCQLLEKDGPRQAIVLPGHDVGIQQVPRLARQDARADLRFGFDEPLRGQHFDRFAQCGAARGHGRAGLERIARADIAPQNTPSERVHDPSVQVAMRVAL
jgi:hypothetical protein